jgi:hypothetical protein
MTSRFALRATRFVLAAALAFGTATLQAASGIAVNQYQEAAVKVGMTAAEVRQVLGRPAQVIKYYGAPGPSWTYEVVEGRYGSTQFGVDFSADGTVVSAREYAFPTGGG